MIYKRLLLISIIFIISGNLLHAQAAPPLCRSALLPKIERLIKNNNANQAFWALTVRDTTGRLLQCFNSNKMMHPASNLKLLVTAVSLHELGPDFKFRTPLYGRGSQQGSVWVGDLIVRGKGDPSMSGLFYDDDRLHVFREFYDALKTMGINKIRGNLIANDSYFDQRPYPDGWQWDDFSYYYAVPINALSFNNNTIDLTIYANGEIGDRPKVEWFPFNINFVNIVNNMQITPRNAYYVGRYHRVLGTNMIYLQGSIPHGHIARHSLSVSKPALYFITALKKYLEKSGIKITGHLIVNNRSRNWDNSSYKVLTAHTSPPLHKIIKHMNKKSDNFYAEMLLKTVAAEHFNTQGTTELGISLEKKFASSIGINVSKMNVSDGSGMSAYDLITTNALSKILVTMHNNPAFVNSLSIGGVDGTLEYRFGNTPLVNRVFAKTGYVSGVRSISGYLKTKSDNTLIFSLITNNYVIPTRYVNSTEGDILTVLYNHY